MAVARAEVEASILAHTREILRAPDLTLADDFFAAGGNSLSAVILSARLSDLFGIELSLESIFDAYRLADIADAVVASGALRE